MWSRVKKVFNTFKIDPTNMNEEESFVLNEFLQQEYNREAKRKQPKRKIFKANKTFKLKKPIEINNKKFTSIKLERPILYRSKKQQNRPEKIYVLGEQIGEGGFGKVFEILGLLTPQENKPSFTYERKKLVVKIMDHGFEAEQDEDVQSIIDPLAKKTKQVRKTEEYFSEAKKESELSKRINELKAEDIISEKELVDASDVVLTKPGKIHTKSFFVMANKGITLASYLEKNPKLSLQQRSELAAKVLSAYQEQIIAHDLIHRDIKPDNILIDTDESITFADLGLTIQQDQPFKTVSGTAQYCAPELLQIAMNPNSSDLEMFLNEVNKSATDYFSLGLVLGEIFGAETNVRGAHPGDVIKYAERANHFQRTGYRQHLHRHQKLQDPIIFRNLSESLRKLNANKEEEKTIRNVLDHLTYYDSQKRSVVEARKNLEKILPEKKEIEKPASNTFAASSTPAEKVPASQTNERKSRASNELNSAASEPASKAVENDPAASASRATAEPQKIEKSKVVVNSPKATPPEATTSKSQRLVEVQPRTNSEVNEVAPESTTILKIDPTNMNAEHSRILAQFLRQELLRQEGKPKRKYFDIGKTFELDSPIKFDDRIIHSIELTHPILYRSKTNKITNTKEVHYDVLGKKLGGGSFGQVYEISGTLKPLENEKFAYDTRKKRVVKIVTHFNNKYEKNELHEEDIDEAENQYREMQKEAVLARDMLNAKKLTSEKKSINGLQPLDLVKPETGKFHVKSFLVMDYKGISLESFLETNKNLSLTKRYELAINLLRAYQEQIVNHGLIHRDIKPKNILINPETSEIYFIDLGYTIRKEEKPDQIAGTAQYCAPELLLAFDNKKSRATLDLEKTDYYSLGLVLGNILEAESGIPDVRSEGEVHPYIERAKEMKAKAENKHTAKANQFLPLFRGLFANLQVDGQEKEDVQNILQNLTDYDPNERSLDKAFVCLDQKLVAHRLEEKAHQIGLTTREQLRAITRGDEPYFAAKLKETSEFPALIQMKTSIATGLARIDEKPESVEEFVKALGVKAFAGMFTKGELLRKAEDILFDYSSLMQDLFKESEKLEMEIFLLKQYGKKNKTEKLEKELKENLNEVQALIKKDEKLQITFDDLNKFNQKDTTVLKDKLEQLENKLKQADSNANKYATLFAKSLDTENTAYTSISRLQNHLKSVIHDYMRNTLTPKNISKKDRAASSRRYNEMDAILEKIDAATDPEKLIEAVKIIINSNTRKFYFFKENSELHNNIIRAINQFKKEEEQNRKEEQAQAETFSRPSTMQNSQ